MIHSKTLRGAARVLLGAFIAAYAMVSLHATARAPQGLEIPMPQVQTIASGEAYTAAEGHCQEPAADPAPLLLCKVHCQNAVQTLDHPHAQMADDANHAYLVVAACASLAGRGTVPPAANRAEATHHGGAPPLYQSTARLRI